MLKIGDKVRYVGSVYVNLFFKSGIIHDLDHDKHAVVYFPDLEDGFDVGRNGIRLWRYGTGERKYLIVGHRDLEVIKGDDSMKKILVVGNTGSYLTDAKKGDILDVIEERFGYVVTLSGRVKDIDYVDYKDGEMIAHINDLRDCFALGMKFNDDNNLVYPDGKVALKAENVQYLDRAFKLKRLNDNQIIIGNEKVEICFGKNEIGKIVEFRR